MRILVTDDEPFALEDSFEAIKEALPEAEVVPADNYRDALNETEDPFDLAFLDVEMPGMTGLELAEELQKKYPKINVIFVTAFPQYALEAYKILASDYCLKPLNPSDVKRAVANLRYSLDSPREIAKPEDDRIKIVCFGDFNFFDSKGSQIMLQREKAKELFAYLVSKRGVESTPTELCDALWGDSSENKLDYFWKLTSELRKALRDINAEDVLRQGRGKYSVDPSRIICDYYEYLDKTMRDKWNGKFMEQYGGWAEVIKGSLLRKTS